MDKTSDWKFSEPCVIYGLKGVGDITVFFKASRGLKELNCAITKITLLEYLGSDGDSDENLLNTYRKHKQRIHGFAERAGAQGSARNAFWPQYDRRCGAACAEQTDRSAGGLGRRASGKL